MSFSGGIPPFRRATPPPWRAYDALPKAPPNKEPQLTPAELEEIQAEEKRIQGLLIRKIDSVGVPGSFDVFKSDSVSTIEALLQKSGMKQTNLDVIGSNDKAIVFVDKNHGVYFLIISPEKKSYFFKKISNKKSEITNQESKELSEIKTRTRVKFTDDAKALVEAYLQRVATGHQIISALSAAGAVATTPKPPPPKPSGSAANLLAAAMRQRYASSNPPTASSNPPAVASRPSVIGSSPPITSSKPPASPSLPPSSGRYSSIPAAPTRHSTQAPAARPAIAPPPRVQTTNPPPPQSARPTPAIESPTLRASMPHGGRGPGFHEAIAGERLPRGPSVPPGSTPRPVPPAKDIRALDDTLSSYLTEPSTKKKPETDKNPPK